MKKKYIVFDFDGTLVNTNDIIVDSWQATFEHYLGYRFERSAIEATFGEILSTTMKRLIPDADCEEAMGYYRSYQEAHKDEGIVHVYDGITDLLGELRTRGYLIGVATSRTTYSLWNYLRQFDMEEYIDAAVTMNDVKRHKPDPDTLTVAIAKLAGLAPGEDIPEDILAESVMIGDTGFDVGCANNAGVDSVLVGWSHYVDEDDMAERGFVPTYRINRPAELLELI